MLVSVLCTCTVMWVGGVWVGGSYILLSYITKQYWLCHAYPTILPWECGEGRYHIFLHYPTKAWSTTHALCNPAIYYEWEEERWGKGGRAQCPVSGANPSQCIPFQAIPYHNIPSQCIPYQCIPHHTNPGGSLGRIPSSPLMVWYCIFWYRPLQYLWYQTIVVAWYWPHMVSHHWFGIVWYHMASYSIILQVLPCIGPPIHSLCDQRCCWLWLDSPS